MLEVALAYVRRGWNPVPIVYRGKRPIGDGWQHRRITEETAPQYFNGAGYNIGLQLGLASNGLTDVDLDCREAILIAPYVLPTTQAIFGRQSKRASHHLYMTDLCHQVEAAAFQFRDPRKKDILVELRIGAGDKGAQTVVPPSMHESGEEVRWEENGEPAPADGDELVHMVRLVAACALLARYWPARDSHARHQAALVVGGFLSRCGLQRHSLREYVGAIALAAGDEEWRDRRKAAEDASVAHGAGKHTFGFNGLADMFGRDLAEKIAEWLDYGGDGERPNGAARNGLGEPQTAPQKKLPYIVLQSWRDRKISERPWAVPERIPLRQTTLLSGEGAAGKSLLLLHLCVATVLGRDWLKTLPLMGPALFADAEDDEEEIIRRLNSIRLHYECGFDELAERGLYVISFAGEDAVLAVARHGKIEPTPRYAALLEAAGDLKPKIIGLASAANLFAGNENDRAQVQQFIGLLTRLAITGGSAVVLASHPSLTGIASDSGLSGTTAWHNSVRARLYMRGLKDADSVGPSDLREIVFKKSNYSLEADSVVVRWQQGLFLPAATGSDLERLRTEAEAEEAFLIALDEFAARGLRVSPRPGPGYAPAEFAKTKDGAKLGKKVLTAAMVRLFEAKRIIAGLNPDVRPSRAGTVILRWPS